MYVPLGDNSLPQCYKLAQLTASESFLFIIGWMDTYQMNRNMLFCPVIYWIKWIPFSWVSWLRLKTTKYNI